MESYSVNTKKNKYINYFLVYIVYKINDRKVERVSGLLL